MDVRIVAPLFSSAAYAALFQPQDSSETEEKDTSGTCNGTKHSRPLVVDYTKKTGENSDFVTRL